ncbi:MAG: class I SAM-dependent methyltransferase [Patescibacteria group bacterium]
MEDKLNIWVAQTPGYKLLDSGNKKKLEEVSGIRIVRSEPRAWWKSKLSQEEWNKAEALFEHEKGNWMFSAKGGSAHPEGGKNFDGKDLDFEFKDLKVKIKFPATSKHIGIFPEQASQWNFIEKKCGHGVSTGREVKVLNLFGYTGISSLVAAKAGASVTHVDGSRTVIGWARENQEASGLNDKPIRWILDDVGDFVKREIKRGNKYDAIIMDPPSFGRGPQGQVWKVEEQLVELLKICREAMSDKPLFLILNMYSTELSSITLKNLLEDLFKDGEVIAGELALKEENSERLLPLSIFANWSDK